ncbi:Clip1 [Symbiodinium sp. CCMP2592]|nr:Clip1 [Symbiodinium sp. CCMP2592]
MLWERGVGDCQAACHHCLPISCYKERICLQARLRRVRCWFMSGSSELLMCCFLVTIAMFARLQHFAHHLHSEAECTCSLMSLVGGDRVEIRGEGGPQADKEVLLGTVRFVGEAAFAPGEWLGLELDRQVGKNNGSVKGKTYFQCEPGHGIFVRPHCVTKVSARIQAC